MKTMGMKIIRSNQSTPLIRMMTFSVLWLIFLENASIHAQVFADSSFIGMRIDSIQIQGNQKTKAAIILREMKSQIGDSLDLDLLVEDQQRIQNLRLFNRVLIYTEAREDAVELLVHVTEQWYLFPYPIFFINERDWGKLSYGAGLMHLNFRGRAETLSGSFWLGYNPAVQLEYINPWIGGKHHLRLRTYGYYQKIRSKHYSEKEITENHLGMRGILGKRFGYHTHVNLSLGYREVTFSPADSGQTLSIDGRDRLPSLGFSFIWDHRDLVEYPHKGWYLYLSAVKTGMPSMTADYLHYGFDSRAYIPMGSRITLAFRLDADLTHGTIPVYDRLYIGYTERIRGHFFEAFEGENRALASAALRVSLLPVRYFNLADQPQLRNLKFGLSLGLFADTGTVWFQSQKVDRSMLISGYGLGLHFHLPYIHVLRLEAAIDENGKSQLILDMLVDI